MQKSSLAVHQLVCWQCQHSAEVWGHHKASAAQPAETFRINNTYLALLVPFCKPAAPHLERCYVEVATCSILSNVGTAVHAVTNLHAFAAAEEAATRKAMTHGSSTVSIHATQLGAQEALP
jgi:hypothetical protein